MGPAQGTPARPQDESLRRSHRRPPLGLRTFAGDIPKGEYGAGKVTIWDHGTYETEKWRTNEIMVVLHGKRAQGRYVLFPTGEKNWMIHRMDPAPADYEAMPDHLEPMLATGRRRCRRRDEEWAYEFKWDGVRAMVYVDGGRVRALTRNDKNLDDHIPRAARHR